MLPNWLAITAKIKLRGLSIIFLSVGILGPCDFIMEDWLHLTRMISDIGAIALSVLIFSLIIFTQKPPVEKEEYIPAPSRREIKW